MAWGTSLRFTKDAMECSAGGLAHTTSQRLSWRWLRPGLSPGEVTDGLHDHKGPVITLSQMQVDSITKFLPSVRALAFRGRDLLEQCSFTGGRHSSLAMSVFLMVKASST